jgi:hypothetical protein
MEANLEGANFKGTQLCNTVMPNGYINDNGC